MVLVQGVSSGERMDFTVRKSVELGVAEIHPVLAHASVAGPTRVRVVRHAIGPTGKAAMGLEVLWQRAEDAARDASGVFAL